MSFPFKSTKITKTAILISFSAIFTITIAWKIYAIWVLAKINYQLEYYPSEGKKLISKDCKGADEEGHRYHKVSGRLQSLKSSMLLEGPGIEYIATFIQIPEMGGEVEVMFWAGDAIDTNKIRYGKEYSFCIGSVNFRPSAGLPLYQGVLTTMELK